MQLAKMFFIWCPVWGKSVFNYSGIHHRNHAKGNLKDNLFKYSTVYNQNHTLQVCLDVEAHFMIDLSYCESNLLPYCTCRCHENHLIVMQGLGTDLTCILRTQTCHMFVCACTVCICLMTFIL